MARNVALPSRVQACGAQEPCVPVTSLSTVHGTNHVFVARGVICLAGGDVKVPRRGSILIRVASMREPALQTGS